MYFLRRAGEINAWIDNIAEADAEKGVLVANLKRAIEALAEIAWRNPTEFYAYLGATAAHARQRTEQPIDVMIVCYLLCAIYYVYRLLYLLRACACARSL